VRGRARGVAAGGKGAAADAAHHHLQHGRQDPLATGRHIVRAVDRGKAAMDGVGREIRECASLHPGLADKWESFRFSTAMSDLPAAENGVPQMIHRV